MRFPRELHGWRQKAGKSGSCFGDVVAVNDGYAVDNMAYFAWIYVVVSSKLHVVLQQQVGPFACCSAGTEDMYHWMMRGLLSASQRARYLVLMRVEGVHVITRMGAREPGGRVVPDHQLFIGFGHANPVFQPPEEQFVIFGKQAGPKAFSRGQATQGWQAPSGQQAQAGKNAPGQ